MPTNDFIPFGNTPGANVVSQPAYVILTDPGGGLVDGFQSGLAPSDRFNKVMRQSATMAYVLAQTIVDELGEDVLDDGNPAAIVTQLAGALSQIARNGAWSTGDVKLTMKAVADTGWIMMQDQTIGDATSGATYANAAAEDLFLLLWTNVANAWAPVVGGRGGSAAADWAAHKRITLTRTLGRALAISGSGAGLTARALGEYLGEESTALVAANNGAHTHTGTTGNQSNGHTHTYSGTTSDESNTHTHDQRADNFTTGTPYTNIGAGAAIPVYQVNTSDPNVAGHTHNYSGTTSGVSDNHTHSFTTDSQGSGTPHNTMQPTTFMNAMIKL